MNKFYVFLILILCSCSNNICIENQCFNINNENDLNKAVIVFDSVQNTLSPKNEFEILNDFLKISKEKNLLKTESNILRRLGNYYYNKNNLIQAIDYYNQSVEKSQITFDSNSLHSSLSNIGLLYFNLNNFELAEEYFNRAININIKNIQNHFNYYYLSNIFLKKEDKKQAIINSKKSWTLFLNLDKNIKNFYPDSLTYLVNYMKMSIYDSTNFESTFFNYLTHINDSIFTNTFHFLNSCWKANFSITQNNLLQTLANHSFQNLYLDKEDVLNLKLNLYEKTNQQDSVIKFQKLCFENLKNNYKINQLTNLHQINLQHELLREESYKNLNSEKNFFKQSVFITVLISILLIFIIILLRIQHLNKKKRLLLQNELKLQNLAQELNIDFLQKIDDNQEKQRNYFAAELHDRLGGLLVMGNHQINQLEKDNTDFILKNRENWENLKNLMKSTLNETRSISKGLSSLNENNSIFSLLTNLSKNINKISEIEINLNIYPENIVTENKIKSVIYRVCQEALSNILKYSNAKQVNIYLTENENEFNLMIEDNGIGFDKSVRTIGLGLKNMEMRVKEIGGEFIIDSTENKGTTINVNLNKNFENNEN